ncbi:MAG TPA: hypothetical protein VFZ23_05820 [Pyrinomonadaceae bacterium]
MRIIFALFIAATVFALSTTVAQLGAANQQDRVSVRTENFPRPPYSGATYYIYERGGEVICTKLEVCSKFDDCSVEYKKGSYKDEIDIEIGEPYGKTEAVLIPKNKLRKHVCLTKFKLLSK